VQRIASRMPFKPLVLALAVCTAGAGAGCAAEERASLPQACRQGPQAVLDALARAPGPVRIDGVPISGCMNEHADAADLQELGAAVNGAAARLAQRAARRPESPAALRLGYLSAAVRRGAQRSGGLHSELVRRVDQELLGVDRSSAAFRRGQSAGRQSG